MNFLILVRPEATLIRDVGRGKPMFDDERPMGDLMGLIDFLLDDLDAICRTAFTTYRGYAPEVLVEHDSRAAANCTYSHIAAEAERRFATHHPKVQLLDPRPLGGLKVWRAGETGADALIRFKKHDGDGFSRNYPTKQARQYDRGVTLPGLPPEAVRLSVGYFLDPTGTEFVRTQVARPMGKRIDWCAAIVPQPERRPGEKVWVEISSQRKF
jgi:hypothetical protein